MSNLFETVKQALLQLNQSISSHFECINEAIQKIIPSSTEVVPTEEYAASIRVAMESLRTIKNNQAAMEQLLQHVVERDNMGLSPEQLAYVGRLQFTTLLNIQARLARASKLSNMTIVNVKVIGMKERMSNWIVNYRHEILMR